jgi:hypothetical protein
MIPHSGIFGRFIFPALGVGAVRYSPPRMNFSRFAAISANAGAKVHCSSVRTAESHPNSTVAKA